MNDKQKRTNEQILEKIKLLEGISSEEWIRIKTSIDLAFKRVRSEQPPITLSVGYAENAFRCHYGYFNGSSFIRKQPE